MVAAVQFLHALTRDMRVYLRRGHIAVTQQQLDDTQISAIIEQMGREGMAQSVWRQLLPDAGLFGITFSQPQRQWLRHRKAAQVLAGTESFLSLPCNMAI